MGLFDFFKIIPSKNNTLNTNQNTISNEEYQLMRNKEIEILEKRYNLTSVDGIKSISIAQVKEYQNHSITGQIEYYLLLKGGQFETTNQTELAIACYRKANELMPNSNFIFSKDKYMRLPRYLRKLRRFDEARQEELIIENLLVDDTHKKFNFFISTLSANAKELNTDLVEATSCDVCCSECAKYRNRVYSLSGKDRRFPKLPDALVNNQHNCGIALYPFIYNVSTFYNNINKKVDPIKYSSRPFVDDRTQDEKQKYLNRLQKDELERVKDKNRSDYNWIWENLPEYCPKSLSGYVRMKNNNSENYKIIVCKAKELEYFIE